MRRVSPPDWLDPYGMKTDGQEEDGAKQRERDAYRHSKASSMRNSPPSHSHALPLPRGEERRREVPFTPFPIFIFRPAPQITRRTLSEALRAPEEKTPDRGGRAAGRGRNKRNLQI